MKKFILTLMAAAMMPVLAMAQGCPTPATATATVTLKRKIPGLLDGNFSVSATKKVAFAGGNLQYTKSTGKWKIMEHQYDMVETLNQNVGTDYASQGVVTFFGWGTAGNSEATGAYQPYATSTTNTEYVKYLTAAGEWTASKSDWGVFNSGDLGAGWRTLTTDEWVYLFNSRTPGNSVNGVSNARFTHATINTDGTAVNGIILFPDDAVMTTVSGVTWGNINNSSAWGTQCTSAGWTALETAGCVFLPAAGVRSGNSVVGLGVYGRYWSSSAYSATTAYNMYFNSGGVSLQFEDNRFLGCSVRLVQDVE